jgi:hypothetical protein
MDERFSGHQCWSGFDDGYKILSLLGIKHPGHPAQSHSNYSSIPAWVKNSNYI